jgi:hypothetical protein
MHGTNMKILEQELLAHILPQIQYLLIYGYILKNALQPNIAFKSKASHSLVYVNM